jgi:formiminoglutamase
VNQSTSNKTDPLANISDDPRIKHLLGKKIDESNPPKAIIIGFPSDEGVRRNGGRQGAAQAPDKIRNAFYKMTLDTRNLEAFTDLIVHTEDAGNINITGNLENDQQQLAEEVSHYLKDGSIPIILGGGHGTAFGHFSGYVEAGLKTSIFNLDAHTDVRPLKNGKAHSGSPFRQAIEHESSSCEKYCVAGLQPHSVAAAHLDFIYQNGGQYLFRNEASADSINEILDTSKSENLMITLDMDGVDQAYAPGVSAPCTNGLTPDLFCGTAYLAGKNRHVTSFDISEVNPKYDRDSQTARLAALAVWHFFAGLCHRRL